MRLYHSTPAKNAASIMQMGLLRSFAMTRHCYIWLHRWGHRAWAKKHAGKRHGVDERDMVVLRLKVAERCVCEMTEGFWVCREDIPPDQIELVTD